MSGLEGVIMVNTVTNPKDAKRGSRKKLKSMITHNDGAHWSYIQPPYIDSNGDKYECSGKTLESCSLNLHGYTEREDERDTFSSGSAVGMMIGIGNVGENLENYYSGNTFLTRDGGITWKEVKKGVYMWEYGDQGSIIVLVNGKDNTNKLSYSVDEGETWVDYQFTDEAVTVEDISTVPSDNSLKFLLFTRVPLARGDKTKVFRIDFSQLLPNKCNLDLQHPDVDDFELWTPEHPFQKDRCLFGHEVQYYRKITGKLCRVGKKLNQPYTVVRNCPCTKQDYECDFNYFRDSSGACKLVRGYSEPDHSQICNADDAPDEYFLPTGYRKIALSTCEGGEELDKSSRALPCKGKEDEFYKKHPRPSWFSKFLLWLLIIATVLFVGNVAYKFYVNHKYGEIRLDEEGNFSVVENVGGRDAYLQQFKDYN
ncbi:unnamed protein product [Ambrosiozyma monospora]|uniref:Unnamed protein product n=1 Tax=Ambrosiozyma monospora TaxID=43982 RepID=A0ACB5TB94_AMBMO|nr:unnamed protein product [Ambrosiozyma monospora]